MLILHTVISQLPRRDIVSSPRQMFPLPPVSFQHVRGPHFLQCLSITSEVPTPPSLLPPRHKSPLPLVSLPHQRSPLPPVSFLRVSGPHFPQSPDCVTGPHFPQSPSTVLLVPTSPSLLPPCYLSPLPPVFFHRVRGHHFPQSPTTSEVPTSPSLLTASLVPISPSLFTAPEIPTSPSLLPPRHWTPLPPVSLHCVIFLHFPQSPSVT